MSRRYHLGSGEMDAQVLGFSGALKPAQWIQEEGQKVANAAFVKLQSDSNFGVVDMRYSGSLAKETGMIEPDFDFVVVVNVDPTTYKKVSTKILEEFRRILDHYHEELGIISDSLRYFANVNALKFTLRSGLECDILPAINRGSREILQTIKGLGNPTKDWKVYSNSLMHEQVAFVKSFKTVHPLIRLAKLWIKSVHVIQTGKVLGGMTIVELVAIAAYLRANSGSIVQQFLHFLDMMINLKNTKVAFQKHAITGKWIAVNENQLNNFDSSLVPRVIGTLEILQRSFFIIDPANPYNDLLQDQDRISPNLCAILMRCARVTKNKISALMAGLYVFRDGSINFLKLLKPQPYSLATLYPSGVPHSVRIHYSLRGFPKYSHITEIKPGCYKNDGRLLVNALRTDIMELVNIISIRIEQSNERDRFNNFQRAKRAIKSCLKEMIRARLPSVNLLQSRSPRDHSEMHLILDVPYTIKGYNSVVRVSFRW